MIRCLVFALPFAALGACAPAPEGSDHPLAWDNFGRAIEASFEDQPFANGAAVSVVTAEREEMRTYNLVPCRGGTRICGGSAHGPAGTLTATPDHSVVRGAYRGRAFYLSPGGDGAVIVHGTQAPLAWE